MAQTLDYSGLYDFDQAATALGVSRAWVEKYVGNAIKQGLITSMNGKEEPILVTGAALKKIAMQRWAQLETELRNQAFLRVRARDQALMDARERDDDEV